MSIDAKEAARRIIASQIEDTEYMSCLEMTADEADEAGLTHEQHDEIGRKIHDLIGEAMVTVILPGDEVCPHCHGTGTPEQAESEAGK